MKKFKKGDVVKCVRGYGHIINGYEVGRSYGLEIKKNN